MVDLGRIIFPAVRAVVLAGTVIGVAMTVPARAQVVESASILNSYSYTVGSLSGANSNAPGNVALFLSDKTGGYASDLGLGLTASLGQGSFSFLQNGFCVGACKAQLTTDVTFTLTNMSAAPVALRFDSLITPGHLGQSNFVGATNAQRGDFAFSVTQDSTVLYSADGVNSRKPPKVETSDGKAFNNLLTDPNLPAWNVVDWSATPLNINLLTIGAGQTSTFTYHSLLTVATTDATCLDTTQCLGYQVAFGDPRSAGAPTLARNSLVSTVQGFSTDPLPSFSAAAAASSSPAVGAAFSPYTVYYAFVPVGSPLPPPPELTPKVPYDIPYRSVDGALPEPATWAMMLIGFAAIGATARRRRTLSTIAQATA